MKDIQKPNFMQKAAQGKRGHLAVIEILIAVAVFAVGSLLMGVIQVPLMIFQLMSNEEYMKSVMRRDVESVQKAMEITTQVPEWMMIVILISEILIIMVVILYCRWLEKRKSDTLGFRKRGMFGQYALGVIGGLLFFSVAYLLCVLTGSIHFDGMAEEIAPLYLIGYLIGYMIQGMAEEVLCRGYLFVSLTRRYPVTYSILTSAIFFALLHGMNPGVSFLAIINLVLYGIFAALMMVKYENIWIVGAFHSIWNFAQGNLYGIQVSGNSLQKSVFASTCKDGMSVINGGSFGMEGGLGVTIVLGAGIAYLIWSLNKAGKIIEQPQNTPFQTVMHGTMPTNGNQPWSGNAPQGGSQSPFGNVPQGGNQQPSGDVPQGGNQSPFGNVPQGGNQQPSRQIPQGGNQQPSGQVPQQGMASSKRENMGIKPGETPWHPNQAEQSDAQGASQQDQTTFNADYFKD